MQITPTETSSVDVLFHRLCLVSAGATHLPFATGKGSRPCCSSKDIS